MLVTFTTRGERDAKTKVSVDFFSLSKDDRSSHWSSLINCGDTSLDFQSDKKAIKLFFDKVPLDIRNYHASEAIKAGTVANIRLVSADKNDFHFTPYLYLKVPILGQDGKLEEIYVGNQYSTTDLAIFSNILELHSNPKQIKD